MFVLLGCIRLLSFLFHNETRYLVVYSISPVIQIHIFPWVLVELWLEVGFKLWKPKMLPEYFQHANPIYQLGDHLSNLCSLFCISTEHSTVLEILVFTEESLICRAWTFQPHLINSEQDEVPWKVEKEATVAKDSGMLEDWQRGGKEGVQVTVEMGREVSFATFCCRNDSGEFHWE